MFFLTGRFGLELGRVNDKSDTSMSRKVVKWGRASRFLTARHQQSLGFHPYPSTPTLPLGYLFLWPTKFPLVSSSLSNSFLFCFFPPPLPNDDLSLLYKVHMCAFRNIIEENKTKLGMRMIFWKVLVFVLLSMLSRFSLGLERQGTVPGDFIRLDGVSQQSLFS